MVCVSAILWMDAKSSISFFVEILPCAAAANMADPCPVMLHRKFVSRGISALAIEYCQTKFYTVQYVTSERAPPLMHWAKMYLQNFCTVLQRSARH